jgi:hypothetical protein
LPEHRRGTCRYCKREYPIEELKGYIDQYDKVTYICRRCINLENVYKKVIDDAREGAIQQKIEERRLPLPQLLKEKERHPERSDYSRKEGPHEDEDIKVQE